MAISLLLWYVVGSDKSKAKFEDSMGRWLQAFKFLSVERGIYDRLECPAKRQIYPLLEDNVVGDITAGVEL